MLKPAVTERASRSTVAGPHEHRAGSLLRARRKSYGVTQKKLAEQVGISWSHVKRIEAGRATPSSRVRAAIAEALCSDVLELFGDFPFARRQAQVLALYRAGEFRNDFTMPALAAKLGV